MPVSNSRFKFLIACFLLFLALFCPLAKQAGAEGNRLLEMTDALGRQVVLSAPPQRIVTIFSSNTELVAALGFTEAIVGIDAMTYYPPEIVNRPKIGGRLGISLEQVLSQRPDLVVMTPARQAVHTLLTPLDRLGIPTVVLTSRTALEVMDNLEQVAWLLGKPEAGRRVRQDMQRRFDAVRQRRQGLNQPRVILITSRLSSGLFMTARKGTYTADIIGLAGGISALDPAEENPRASFQVSPQISPEALLGLDPDIIIYTRRRGEGKELGEFLARPAFSALKAQRNGHIFDVPSAEFLIPGPRIAAGVERLADIFEQWDKP